MKVLIVLSLVALCYSTPITVNKHVTVGGDGTITVTGIQGRQLDIYQSLVNPTKLNIIFKSPFGTTRKVQIDEITNDIENVPFNFFDARFFSTLPREEVTQARILAHIFRQYEGIVDEPTYLVLLGKIETLVRHGYVHQAILEALRTFEKVQLVEGMKMEQAKNVVSNIVREQLIEETKYPAYNQMHGVSGIVPVQGVRGLLNQYQNTLPYQKYYGQQQGLWNIKYMTPYQRQAVLQHLRQKIQIEKLEGRVNPIDVLKVEELEQIMGQPMYQYRYGQSQVTPLNRFLTNMGLVGGQQYYPKYQGQYMPQQWQQLKQLEQLEKMEELKQLEHQQYYQQVYPQGIYQQSQFVPQQYQQTRYVPQQYVNGRFPLNY